MSLFKKLASVTTAFLLGLSTVLPLVMSASAAASDNLIANASVETPDPSKQRSATGMAKSGWGTNSATYSYLNSGQDGNRSVQVQVNSYTNGDVKWYFAPVSVQTCDSTPLVITINRTYRPTSWPNLMTVAATIPTRALAARHKAPAGNNILPLSPHRLQPYM